MACTCCTNKIKPVELFTIDDLWTDVEIDSFIHLIRNSNEGKPFNLNTNFKNKKVLMPDLSAFMYQRIQSRICLNYESVGNAKTQSAIVRASPYIFYAEIKQNQQFGIHTDTGSVYDKDKNEYSRFTFLIYLNEGFEGGETQFYSPNVSITPKRGRTLFFDIDLLHKGNTVLSDSTKLWIGSELVCLCIGP